MDHENGKILKDLWEKDSVRIVKDGIQNKMK